MNTLKLAFGLMPFLCFLFLSTLTFLVINGLKPKETKQTEPFVPAEFEHITRFSVTKTEEVTETVNTDELSTPRRNNCVGHKSNMKCHIISSAFIHLT